MHIGLNHRHHDRHLHTGTLGLSFFVSVFVHVGMVSVILSIINILLSLLSNERMVMITLMATLAL